jgi:nucleolar protein 53
VLLTEELTGNLRTVSGTHTLIRDRLKSLQRRALVEPRRKVEKVKSKSYIKYQPGSKGEKESDMHRETLKAGAN